MDLVSARERRRLLGLLRTLNPGADILPTRQSAVPLARVINTQRFNFEKAAQSAGWLKVCTCGVCAWRGVGGGSSGLTDCHVADSCLAPASHAICSTTDRLASPASLPSLCLPASPLQTLGEGYVHQPESEEYGIASLVYRARRPFHPARLHTFIDRHFVLQEPEWVVEQEEEEEEEEETEAEEEAAEGEGAEEEEHQPPPVVSAAEAQQRQARLAATYGQLLRSKGFVWLATRPDLFGEWSQVGAGC